MRLEGDRRGYGSVPGNAHFPARGINHHLGIINRYKLGMSSLSSVNGRSNLTMQQKMEYDLRYAQQASFALDITLLIRTVFVVISRRGAR